MKFPHLFRCLICFLLIVALVGNAFFTPVNASAVAFSKVAIDSLIVVGSAIMGLGVLAGSDTNAYKSLASSVVSALGLGSVIDVVTWAVSGGAYKYVIPQTLVSSIRDYLFSSSVVTEELVTTAKLPAGAVIQGKDQAYTLNTGCMAFSWQYGNLSSRTIMLIPYDLSMSSAQNLCTPALGAGSVWITGFNWVYFNSIGTSSSSAENQLGLVKIKSTGSTSSVVNDFLTGDYEFTPQKTVVTTETYRLGAVALHDAAISVAYPDWYANSVVVPGSVAGSSGDDDDEVYLPLAPGKTWGETISGTQEDVWAGAGTWTDGESESGSGAGTGSVSSSISQTWLGQKLDSLVTSISGFFSNVISTIQAVPSAFSSWLDQIIELLRGLAGVISDALVEALSLVFALDAEYVQSEVDKMTSDFVFLGSMVDFGRGLVDVFYGIGSKPPVLYVDLDDAEGDIVWGDRVVFLDLTWYERYKSYGDAIISSFLWAWFGWRLLHNIPGLLNGTSGAVPSSSVFRSWGG